MMGGDKLVVMALLVTAAAVLQVGEALVDKREKGSAYWHTLGLQDIEEALRKPVITGRAKNVVLLLGDGMGPAIITAGRIFKGQKQGRSGEEGYLTFDRLPNVALLKTYNVDRQVPDSAATATAFLSGVKGNYYTMGLTAAVNKGNCTASLDANNRAHSIIMWAQEQGKETGIVTTTRITHATPAAAYGATSDRMWECDSNIKKEEDTSARQCKDLAQQLVEDKPGRDLKVILAGGRQPLGAQLPNSTARTCKRTDGRNLVSYWEQLREAQGSSYAYLTDNQQLNDVDVENTDYIMGLFAESHLDYSIFRDRGPSGQPSISEMTATAIRRLQRAKDGFLLLVEGGRIDHALHDGKPQLALVELASFDDAVRTVLDMVDLQDTLVVVTADHSHGMTINGYPERGNDILGTTSYKEAVTDKMEYTTLMFTTGPGYNYHWDGEKVSRLNVSGVDTHDTNFMFQAAVPTKKGYAAHGGEDVAVYAAGPWAHLFHRVHEQSYVAHVIGYSAGIGPYDDANNRPRPSISQDHTTTAALAAGPILTASFAALAFSTATVFYLYFHRFC